MDEDRVVHVCARGDWGGEGRPTLAMMNGLVEESTALRGGECWFQEAS